MRARRNRVGFPSGSRTAVWLVAIILLAAGALLANSLLLMKNREALQIAESDNRAWTLSQLEASYTRLQLAVSKGRRAIIVGDAPDTDAIRLAFDIFYSRTTAVAATIPSEQRSRALIARMDDLENLRDGLADRIDALDVPDGADLDALDLALADGWSAVREVSLAALMDLVARSEQARLEEKRHLTGYIAISLGLLAMMLVAVLLSGRVWTDLHKRAEISQRSAEMMRRILDSATDAILLTDTAGRLRRANPAAAHMLGEAVAPFALDGTTQESPDLDIGRFLTEDFAGRIGKGRYRTHALDPGGHAVPVDISVVAAPDAHGKRSVLVFVLRDMTREDAAERELRRARDVAEAHAAAKDRFLAAVSHQMRTPLHGLLAAIDLLEAEDSGPHATEMSSIARRCAENQLALVEDILDIARAGATRNGAPFCPARVATDLVQEKRQGAAERGVELNLNIVGEKAPRFYHGCAVAFPRALGKLIDNAIAHGDAGQVSTTLAFAPETGASVRLCVEVEDAGIGIAAEDHDRIFEPFEIGLRADGPARRGAGLGLSVARSLVEAMGGRIELASSPGGGSRFSFALTLQPVTEGCLAASRPALSRHADIGGAALVADDNAVNLTLMRHMVERMGFRADEAVTGQEAVTLAAQRPHTLVVLDYLMPGINGLEAARRIRAAGASRDAMILLVTAVPEQISPEEAAEIGIDAVLPKPIGLKQLAALLRESGDDAAPPCALLDPAPAESERGQQPSDSFDFAELSEMLGTATAEALAVEALEDARRAIDLLAVPSASGKQRADALHMATGSASMTGFVRLGAELKRAKEELENGSGVAPAAVMAHLRALLADAEHRVSLSLARAATD